VQAVFPRADKSAIERMQKMEEQSVGTGTPSVQPSEPGTPARPVLAGGGGGARQPAQPAAIKPGSAPEAKPAATIPDGKISIDDFAKIELRVAQVKAAERVKGADKLLRLEVDLGTEVRQLVAGIAEAYDPESLVGRKVVVVANLAPRKLRGLESNGMIVAASPEGGKPVLASFLEDAPIGTRLK
jgi:methionyl-tRNA synthetase